MIACQGSSVLKIEIHGLWAGPLSAHAIRSMVLVDDTTMTPYQPYAQWHNRRTHRYTYCSWSQFSWLKRKVASRCQPPLHEVTRRERKQIREE